MLAAPAVTVLGSVAVIGRHRTVILGGTNLPALLCLLAITPGRAVANDRLTGALWPDVDPARSRRSLTSLVHQLNLAIDPALGTDRCVRTVKGVGRSLRIDPELIDAVRFERSIAAAEGHVAAGRHDAATTLLAEALSMWHGTPFGGLDLPILVEPAAQLATTRARAEVMVVDAALRCGRADDLLHLLQPRLDDAPEDEQLVSSLARALYEVGRSDDARAVVHRCFERLEHRGIDPTPSLRRLDAAIADGSLPLVANTAPPSTATGQRLQLIGRHAERARLGNWFVGSTAPRSVGRVLAVAGDPGIGKTAVLDAWLHGMADRAVIVRTRCSPEQILPFEAFAPLLVESRRPGEPDDVRTRQQLFERVRERLRSLDPKKVVLLAIDDAQWMTPASVALLERLVDASELPRLRVVLTVRPHEVMANGPLLALVDQWADRRRIETVSLGPLSDDEITRLADRHVRGGLAGRAVLDIATLRALTGGNPLFVIQLAQSSPDELIAVTREDGTPRLPPTVEHLLGHYLHGLSLGVRRGVETAALLGTEGTVSRVARCTGRDELDEISALDAVGDGRLLHFTPLTGSYRFVHELARRTVLAQLPAGRAMRLHAAIASALELEPEPDVFAIAHHLRCAVPVVPPARAADALLAGSRRARELGDFDTSYSLAEHALRATDDPSLQADALVLMASSAQSMGDRDRASRHIGDAIDLAIEANATAVLARALFVKSAVMCSWGSDDLVDRIRQTGALAVDEREADDIGIVEVVWALCLDRPATALVERRSLAERAVRVARAHGDPMTLLQALHAQQLSMQMMLVDPELVLESCAEALGIAVPTRNMMMASLVTSQQLNALMRAGRLDEVRRHQRFAVSVQAQVPDVAFAWATRARTASLALVDDDLDRAERLVADARGIGEPLAGGRPAEEYINHMGVLLLARGSLPGLHHVFDAWVDQPPSNVWHWAVSSGELLDRTEPMAIERLETLVANMASPVPPHSEWLPELTIAAEYAHRSNDHDLGKVIARCIEPFVHQHAVFGVTLSLGSMWRPYALALAAAGDHHGAREAMATARLVNAGAGLALWERLSRFD